MHKNRRQIFISIFFLFAYWLSGLTFIVGINDQKKGGIHMSSWERQLKILEFLCIV